MIKEQKQHIKELKSLYKKEKRYFAVLADCLFEYGQGKDAEKILKENLPLYPDYVTALLVWGKILYFKKNYDEAKEIFLKITQIDNNCVRAYKFLGDIELKLDNRDSYLAFYTEILRYDAFNTNAKNVIALLGKKYDFEAEDQLSSRNNSELNIELDNKETELPAPPKENREKVSVFANLNSSKKSISTKTLIDLGNVNYKDAIKEIDEQYVRSKKNDTPGLVEDNSINQMKKAPTLPRPIPSEVEERLTPVEPFKKDQGWLDSVQNNHDDTNADLRDKVDSLTKSKVDLFFQEQLAKPDKPQSSSQIKDNALFHESSPKPSVIKPAVISTVANGDVEKVAEDKASTQTPPAKKKDDSFSDVESLFEQVTSSPVNKPMVTVSSLERQADQRNTLLHHFEHEETSHTIDTAINFRQAVTPTENKSESVASVLPLNIEHFGKNNDEKSDEQISETQVVLPEILKTTAVEPEVKKSLKDYYQPEKVSLEQEAEFDLVEDIRKSGEFDSLEVMMKEHDLQSNAETGDSHEQLSDEMLPEGMRDVSQENLLRHYDDLDLVEEERVYAQAEGVENGSDSGLNSIQLDLDNSFKKVVVDKVIGELEVPKKRSFKIATSTLGEIYASQGEFHKAKENYYELMTKYPDNSDYRIKFIQAEFNIAAIRINEELDYYHNLTEQFPEMVKYRERFESYQNEYNNLKAELDQKIEAIKKKSVQ